MLSDLCDKIKLELTESIRRNNCDAILLSGGLDSSIIAAIACPRNSFTAGFKFAPDFIYARKIACRFSQVHFESMIDVSNLPAIIENAVRSLETFDPMAIKNCWATYISLKRAKSEGVNTIMSGDGCDELFAGYNYMKRYHGEIKRIQVELERIWKIMHFSSFVIGKSMGITIQSPYLDDKFANFAKSIDINNKMGLHEGKIWGKFILRRCFEHLLGSEIAWRPKMAQEQGCGADSAMAFFETTISNEEYADGIKIAGGDGVVIRSKEHLYYYRIYRNYFRIPAEQYCPNPCPGCKSCLPEDGRLCRICGFYPSPTKTKRV